MTNNDIILRKYQARVIQDLSRFKLLVCGRRFGKTMILLTEALNQLATPNSLVAYFAPTNAQAKKVFWKKLKQFIPKCYIVDKYESTPYSIRLINGSEITLYGAEAHDRARGSEFDLVLCDEFQDYDPEAWYESIYATLSNREGRALLVGTPKGKGNWSYELTQDPNYKYFHYTTIDGGWVKKSEIELAKKILPLMEFNQEFLASFETSGLTVYYTYDKINQADIEFNPTADTYLCFDFNVSPMSCIIVQQIDGDLHCAVKEFVLNNSNTHDTCEIVNDYLQLQNFQGKLSITGDYAGTRHTTQSDASRSDYVIIENMFKNYNGYNRRIRPTKSIKDRVTAINAMFRNADGDIRMCVNVNKCPRLHKDLINVEWLESGFKLNGTNKDLTHASDALSYFAYNYYPAHYTPAVVT